MLDHGRIGPSSCLGLISILTDPPLTEEEERLYLRPLNQFISDAMLVSIKADGLPQARPRQLFDESSVKPSRLTLRDR
jgi:hypothetical protein